MRSLKGGEDPPKVLPHHRERGPKRWSYSFKDIAEATGYTINTTRTYLAAKGLDLLTVALHIAKAKSSVARRASTDELAAYFGNRLVAWEARWPRFELYLCPACHDPLLHQGLCEEHGGPPRPGLRLGSKYVFVLAGPTYIPLHRIIAGCPPGLDVHHKDGNGWNNRPENLEPLTHEEHWRRHRFGADLEDGHLPPHRLDQDQGP
jgi:hypothetical protein